MKPEKLQILHEILNTLVPDRTFITTEGIYND